MLPHGLVVPSPASTVAPARAPGLLLIPGGPTSGGRPAATRRSPRMVMRMNLPVAVVECGDGHGAAAVMLTPARAPALPPGGCTLHSRWTPARSGLSTLR